MHVLREQRAYAVHEAAEQERAAWAALERATRRQGDDESAVRAYRERWRAAAHSLVDALRDLKT
jgi:hypothetical protein